MRIWIVLFGLVARSTTRAVTVLAQGARNEKNNVSYGGASALGDVVHDHRQAVRPASLIMIFRRLLPTMGRA
jgi:hypothetical protein